MKGCRGSWPKGRSAGAADESRSPEENIPQIENREVARALYRQVEPGDLIPVEMYEAIAEIIALVYQLEESQLGKI